MKYFLFIAFCSSLFFQVACKEKEPKTLEEMTLAEAKKHIKKNRKYETFDGCKVVARPTVIFFHFTSFDPLGLMLARERSDVEILEPFSRSAALGELESVKCLLKSGYDVNAIDEEGLSRLSAALIRSINRNHPKIVEELVKAGADVNEIDSDTGKTFLLKLAEDLDRQEEGDFKEIIKILKAHGAK